MPMQMPRNDVQQQSRGRQESARPRCRGSPWCPRAPTLEAPWRARSACLVELSYHRIAANFLSAIPRAEIACPIVHNGPLSRLRPQSQSAVVDGYRTVFVRATTRCWLPSFTNTFICSSTFVVSVATVLESQDTWKPDEVPPRLPAATMCPRRACE
jgi:hypothetical protein